MPNIEITHKNKTYNIRAIKGIKLSEILQNSNIPISFPCAGVGTCGKCRVRATGELSNICENEEKFLSPQDISNNIRLSCYAKALGDVQITTQSQDLHVVSWSRDADVPLSYDGIGISVDIGTTTMAMRVYNRKTGELLASSQKENPQRIYGADVISRIESCTKFSVQTLSKLVKNTLSEMANDLLFQLQISEISEVVICGNTTMLHILEELDPKSLAVSPFDVVSHFGDFGKFNLLDAKTFLPHCVGAYIGADIVCAVLSSGMLYDNKKSLLIDIGTNGEIALINDGKIICSSTAAGPAFEGALLYMGMNALKGAISHVYKDENDNIYFDVLENAEPIGICGSGIIDMMSVLLQLEIIDETGAFSDEFDGLTEISGQTAFKIPQTEVYITQADVRQIQLAKSAVNAGILTLLHEAKLNFDDIDTLYIAGGFGNFLDRENAANIGLIPKELAQKAVVIGNAALGGASMMLLSEKSREDIKNFIASFEEISLSKSPFFMDAYMDNMMF